MNNQKQTVFARICWWAACAIFLLCGGFSASAAVDPITGAEPAEGFGAGATGGHGRPEVVVTTFAELVSAMRPGNVYIKVQGNLTATSTNISSGSNITIDGQGSATIFGNRSDGQRMLEFAGSNIVVKDIRLRHSGDNLSFKSQNVLVSHVSTTGAYDDGMSISYGSRDVTVQYCAFFGNTRACFIKYNSPQNISMHHNWFKAWRIRAPVVEGASLVDVRNHLNEDWWHSGAYFRDGTTGNLINSTFVLTGATSGDPTRSNEAAGASMYYSGNVYRNCSGRGNTFSATSEFACPPVTTHSAAEAEAIIRASAGCLPRDAIDLAYIAGSSPSIGDRTPWIIEPAAAGPTATVTGPASPVTASPIVFTINFSTSVTGFTAAGITVTNGTKGALSGSGANYTLQVTPTNPGPVTCKVNAGAAQSGGVSNAESNTFSVTYEPPLPPEDYSTWEHLRTIRFAGYTGSETLTSFPLLVRLDAATFPPADFEPAGADLRFADADGNPIPYEIEAWNQGGESSIWVTVPVISSSADYIQMYWGKPGVSSRARPAGVWENDFLGVWHLGSDSQDSTVAGRHGTNNDMTSADGVIGSAANFNGAGFVSLPPAGNSRTGSMSFWMKTSTSEARTMIFYLRAPGASSTPGLTAPGRGYGSQYEMHVDFIPDGENVFLNFSIEGGADNTLDVRATADQAYADGQWRHIAATWEKPGVCHLYVDGAVVASVEHTALDYDITQFAALGKPEDNVRYYTGLMDEARLCAVARSEDWIRACYLNQKRDSAFILYEAGAPTALVTGPASPTASTQIVFNINFSEPVTGFTADGITVTNGVKGNLSGSGASYSILVTPIGPGPVTCVVNSGAAQGGGDMANIKSNTATVIYEGPEDLPSWAYRAQLQFAGFTGPETLTSFPLLVRLDAAEFPLEQFESGGADLRFTDAADNLLPYEIEAWNQGGESSIWVTVPQITSNTDYIQMYWGKPGAVSRSNPARVWTNDFLGVWHLDSSLQDSTAAGRHGTNHDTTAQTGLIGNGANFEDPSFVALPPAGTSTAGSLSVWIKSSAPLTNRTLLFYLRGEGGSSGAANPGDGYGGQNEIHVDFISSGTAYLLNFFIEGGSAPGGVEDVYITDTRAYNDGQWHHIAATWEKPGNCHLYVNGEFIGAREHIGFDFNVDQYAALGKPEDNVRYYNGLMDEARQCDIARSASWIKASYLNQKRDSTFVLFGDPLSVTGAKEWGGY